MSQGAFSNLAHYSAPFRRFGASTLARFGARRRPDGHGGAHGARISRLCRGLAKHLSVGLPWVFCDRDRNTDRPRQAQRRRVELSVLAVGNYRPPRRVSGPDRTCLRGGAGNGVAVRLIVGAQARAEFARIRPARTRFRARSKAAGERLGAVPDRAVSGVGRHARRRAQRAAVGVRHVAVVAVVGGGHADDDRIRRRGSTYCARPVCSAPA